MKLSLIIPVYNEASRFRAGIKLALDYLQSQFYSWEVIVVDDGSNDNSTSTINKANTHVIRTGKNFGKGHAIKIGVEAAAGEYIVFSDIDFSVSLIYLPKFLSALKSSDIAIGSRRLPQSHIAHHQDYLRESLGRGFTGLSNLILGLNHTDLTCGFKGFKRSVAQKLFSLQKLNRWAFDSEILFLAKKLGLRVTEIPVSWSNDPQTKVKLFQDTLTSLVALFQIRLIYL